MDDERMPEASPTPGGAEPGERTEEGTAGRRLDEETIAGEAVAEPGFDPERESAGAGVPNVDAEDRAAPGGAAPSAGRDAPRGGMGV